MKTLMLCINDSLNILHWEKLVELFNKKFIIPSTLSLDDFLNIVFKIEENASEFYQRNCIQDGNYHSTLTFYLKD